jgi:uncharacterized membrane protein
MIGSEEHHSGASFRLRVRFASRQTTGSVVAVAFEGLHQRSLHPLHAILLAGTVPLFLGVLLSDIAYASSYEVQWKNFASWLIVGGLVFGGFALLWALIDLFRADKRRRLYFFVLLASWGVGFVDALVHAKDAWASMPEGLILSAVVAALAITATAFGFSSFRARELR